MIKSMKFAVSAAAAAFAVASLCAVEVVAQSKPEIRIATGRPGGAYFTQGAVLAEAIRRRWTDVNSHMSPPSAGETFQRNACMSSRF